jgi:DNA-binding response OmpR family regulator
MPRILIIEDNPDLAFGLRNNLEIEGYDIELADDGNKGLVRARASDPDLIILDLMVPGLDGYRVLRTLRDEGRKTPVLILSARGEETDKVRGFRLGADDYVTKPFSLLRRAQPEPVQPAGADVFRFGDVTVDLGAQLVYRQGEPVAITHREFLLLEALVRRRGAVASRQDLLRDVWGHRSDIVTRTVDTHIAELRRKLEEDPSRPRHILTIRKMGYRIRT